MDIEKCQYFILCQSKKEVSPIVANTLIGRVGSLSRFSGQGAPELQKQGAIEVRKCVNVK